MVDERDLRSPPLQERAADLVRQMSPETGVVDLSSWEAIRRRMVLRPSSSSWRSRLRLWWAVPALAACTVAGLFFVLSGRSLGVAVEGGRLAEDGEVLHWGKAPAQLRFTDGTVVEMAPAARARVATRTKRGARIVLQSGEIGLAVVHTGRASWQVDAGPYEVQVTGTKFKVRWDRTEERFSLRLTEGSVIVRGGLAGDGVRLKAGQRFESSGPAHWLEIADDARTSPPPATPSASPTASPNGNGTSAPVKAPATESGLAPAASAEKLEPAIDLRSGGHKRHGKPVRLALRSPSNAREEAPRPGLDARAPLATAVPQTPASARSVLPSPVASPVATAPAATPLVAVVAAPAPAAVPPAVVPSRPTPPRVDPSPPPRMMAGGTGCDQHAQFQFEDSTEHFGTPGCCSLAFSALSVDRQHSYCGRSSLRADASFDLQGRPSFTGYPPRQTGEVKVRINPPQDFTNKTVTVRVFVDAPPGVHFSSVLYLVDNAIYVPGGYTESCSPGRWCTLRHTFHLQNPLNSGESVKVDRVSQLAFQIKSLGNMTAWSGRVYIDDIRWE